MLASALRKLLFASGGHRTPEEQLTGRERLVLATAGAILVGIISVIGVTALIAM